MPKTNLYPRASRWPYWKAEPFPPKEGVPVCTAIPYLSGGETVGSELECTMGEWENMQEEPHSYVFHYHRDGVFITGGAGAKYTIAEEDVGTALNCEVTAVNPTGPATVFSNSIQVMDLDGSDQRSRRREDRF